ncbi:hypothetical protein FE257_000736 [Aspergillus nanangensis]|uniref:Uncharacterized protein n=1 Tax=Aspergillus nanangensis TaxID=2582783 RepID=A0AAD4CEM9_ASPNN|nr:hypothetical protein FE257_000736 [Aspergillus nanangensis]
MKDDSEVLRFLPLDDDRITQLMQAAQEGNIRKAKPFLYGVSPDITDHSGRTAFSWLASYNLNKAPSNEIRQADRFAKFLLDRDASPNLGDHHGETPLHWATKEENYLMVELLLQHDVLPDIQDHRGRTPLSRAAERGHNTILNLLLSAQADLDSKDRRGRTPLSWAAENRHFRTVSILLEHGASGEIHDQEGQIPLWWFLNSWSQRAAATQMETTLDSNGVLQQWLALLGPTNGEEPLTKARRTFLSWACERGDIEIVRLLLRTNWANPNSIDRYRKTPLIYALEWNHYDIAELLISGDDSIDPAKRDIVSLRLMIQEGRSRALKPFLERYKQSLAQEDEISSIPLMRIALQKGDRATVSVLLEHKASIRELENGNWFGPCSAIGNSTDLAIINTTQAGYGYIPLMNMAIREGDRAAVAVLLDHREKLMSLGEHENDFWHHGTIRQSSAVHITALGNGVKRAEWLLDETLDQETQGLRRTSEETHLMTFTLSIQMNLQMASTPQSGYESDDDSKVRTIQWAVLEAPPKTVHYFSNLPYGWIPENDLEFVQLFMQTWREDWLTFCQDARRCLSQLRSHQLTARGRDDLLIDAVAENMLQWTHIQGILADQMSQIRTFVAQYQGFSETRRFSEQIHETIHAFDRDISTQIDKLEQTVRDLLQIEFAWVSINEAHRSTSVATSMKRLSWITFVFLPLTFASSLFGMNVDILAKNPSWRWYPLVGGTLLLLAFSVWIFSKFTNVCGTMYSL